MIEAKDMSSSVIGGKGVLDGYIHPPPLNGKMFHIDIHTLTPLTRAHRYTRTHTHTPDPSNNGGQGIRIGAPLGSIRITASNTAGITQHTSSRRTTRGCEAFSGPVVSEGCSNLSCRLRTPRETGEEPPCGGTSNAPDQTSAH